MVTGAPWKKALRYFLIFLVMLTWAFPTIWLISGSLRPLDNIIAGDLFAPFTPTLDNYFDVFKTHNFLSYMINSLITAAVTTAISLTAGTLAAYSITRYRTGGKVYANWIIFTRMAPPAILIIPFYLMFRSLGLINTVWGLVVANITFNVPFVIWTMRAFFESIPEEMEQAALIDGCTRAGVLFRISIPVARSGILTTGLFCFLFVWNEYLFGLTLALSERSKTLPVAVGDFITGYAINWGTLFASGTMVLMPALLVVVFLQSYIVDGLTVGSIK